MGGGRCGRAGDGLSAAEPSLDDDPAVPAVAPLALLPPRLLQPGLGDDAVGVLLCLLSVLVVDLLFAVHGLPPSAGSLKASFNGVIVS